MLTIEPCVFFSAGAAACERNSGARTLVPIRSSHCAGSISPIGVEKNDDALLTSASSRPKRITVWSTSDVELGEVEEIGLDQRDRVGAHAVELGLEEARLAGGRAVVEHQLRARRVQPPADRGTDPLRAAGDQHDLVLHLALLRWPRDSLQSSTRALSRAPHATSPTAPDCPTCPNPTRRRARIRRACAPRSPPRSTRAAASCRCALRRARPLRAGPRLLRRRRAQARRGRRLHDGAGADAAVRAGARRRRSRRSWPRRPRARSSSSARAAAGWRSISCARSTRWARRRRAIAIVETSPDLRERQRDDVARELPRVARSRALARRVARAHRRRDPDERGARRDPAARRRASRRRAGTSAASRWARRRAHASRTARCDDAALAAAARARFPAGRRLRERDQSRRRGARRGSRPPACAAARCSRSTTAFRGASTTTRSAATAR